MVKGRAVARVVGRMVGDGEDDSRVSKDGDKKGDKEDGERKGDSSDGERQGCGSEVRREGEDGDYDEDRMRMVREWEPWEETIRVRNKTENGGSLRYIQGNGEGKLLPTGKASKTIVDYEKSNSDADY